MTDPNEKAFAEIETYPKTDIYSRVYGKVFSRGGLTKREYFAAMAMQGMLPHPELLIVDEGVAKDAVMMADALIAELNKTSG